MLQNKNAGKKMLSSYFFNIRRTRFDQSSPVQPVSDFRGGSTNLTNEQKSLCLILDLQTKICLFFFFRAIFVQLQKMKKIMTNNKKKTQNRIASSISMTSEPCWKLIHLGVHFFLTMSFSEWYPWSFTYVCGSTEPRSSLIVKSCGTNISANVNCITMKFSTISLWL